MPQSRARASELSLALFSRRKRPKRIFIGRFEVAGFYSYLRAGFREIGQATELIIFKAHPFGYQNSDPVPTVLKWRALCIEKAASERFIVRILLRLVANFLDLAWLLQAVARYDAFIFSFGNSLLPKNRDLIFLKFLRKKVICNLAHGSEARPPYLNGAVYAKDGAHPGLERLKSLTSQKKATVRRCEKWATWIIGAPYSSSPFLTKPFVNLFSLGLPSLKSSEIQQNLSDEAGQHKKSTDKFRLLHSPSHPFAKGTDRIRIAVENLIEEGWDIEYIELQGVPNATVLEEIEKCDLVVDQIFSDTPMAGLALEAATLGKPAIVGGEHLDELRKFVDKSMWPPTITCAPNDIETTMRSLLRQPAKLLELGAKAKLFASQKWGGELVAQRFLTLLQGEAPPDWFLEPNTVPFPREFGMTREEVTSNLELMVSNFGRSSLGLKDSSP